MKQLIFLVGAPASGKTTYRKELYELREMTAYISDYNGAWATRVISRDDTRMSLFGDKYKQNFSDEKVVSERIWSAVTAIQNSSWIGTVIVDNTNLSWEHVSYLLQKFDSDTWEARFVIFRVPLWKLYWRNLKRKLKGGRYVPRKIIKNMYKRLPEIERILKEKKHILIYEK